MSPILVRPIREQFEHNWVIRLLVVRFRRKFSVGVNIGDEPEASGVRSRNDTVYPDLVLTTAEGVRRLHGVVEVETAESVNHLEAMAEWAPFGRVRGAFYLYVPASSTDVARRLCHDTSASVTEIWGYHAVGDQMRFTMTYRSARARLASKSKAAKASAAAAAPTKTKAPARKPAAKAPKAKAKTSSKAKAAPKAKAAAKSKAAAKAKSTVKIKAGVKAKPAAKAKAVAKTVKTRAKKTPTPARPRKRP